MISLSDVPVFEKRKTEIYNLFKNAIGEDDFHHMSKVGFILVDSYLAVIADGMSESHSWFSSDFQAVLGRKLLRLKQMSLDVEFGSWISCEMFIDHNNDAFVFYFNFDEYLLFMDHVTEENFRRELMFYPRYSSNVPEWWIGKVTAI